MTEQLTFPQVCVDAHISSSSSQTLVFSVWDVFLGLWVDVFFRQAKVYDVNGVLSFGAGSSYQEVLWLHVSVDQASGVDKLHTSYLRREKRQVEQSNNKLQVVVVKMFSMFVSYQLYGYHEYSL